MDSQAGHLERVCLALPHKLHLLLAAADPKVRFGESVTRTDLCSQALALNEGTAQNSAVPNLMTWLDQILPLNMPYFQQALTTQ